MCIRDSNSVHELLPARIPTVLISNIRGTDDQDARAQWCHDKGYALRANHADFGDITEKVKALQSDEIRRSLANKCAELSNTSGGREIAELLVRLAMDPNSSKESWVSRTLRSLVVHTLHSLTRIYRILRPQSFSTNISDEAAIFSVETDVDFLRNSIKGNRRFEQLIPGASANYLARRKALAERVYP